MTKTKEFLKPTKTFGDTLKFSPYVWAKMRWMRDRGPTEIAGYGITGTKDPLLVTDLILVKQKSTSVTFDLDPEDGIEHTERMMDQGIPPWACMNILCHTHPGVDPTPSGIDETNFKKAFSHPDWAIMFILADNNHAYCRLKINIGPGVIKEMKVMVDWNIPFLGSDIEKWKEEYNSKVTAATPKVDSLLPNYHEDAIWQNNDKIENTFGVEDNCYFATTGDVLYWHDIEGVWYNYDLNTRQWSREDGFGGPSLSIPAPTQPWAQQVIAWANRNVNESDAMTIDELNSQIEQQEHVLEGIGE